MVTGLDLGMPMFTFFPLLVVAAIYGLLSVLLPERMLRQRLSRRPPLSFEEIYRTSFQQLPYQRTLVEDVWNELANDLHLDANKIRPTDRFGEELVVKGFPLVDLNEAVDARLRERLRRNKANSEVKAQIASIKTVLDYIEFTCSIEFRTGKGAPIKTP
jgi:hypothetical protein